MGATLLEENTNTEVIDPELVRASKRRAIKNSCLVIGYVIATLFLALFFVPLLGLFLANEHISNKYPEVIVSPFIGLENVTATIAQPCYYPVYTTNVEGSSLCTVPIPGEFYCPSNYPCLYSPSMFDTQVGCVHSQCKMLTSDCVSAIGALPDINEYSKLLTLEYSPTFLRVFTWVGISVNVFNGFVIAFLILQKNFMKLDGWKYTIGANLLLVTGFLVIVVLAGCFYNVGSLYASDCYVNDDLNNSLNKLTHIFIAYIAIYILGANMGAFILLNVVVLNFIFTKNTVSKTVPN